MRPACEVTASAATWGLRYLEVTLTRIAVSLLCLALVTRLLLAQEHAHVPGAEQLGTVHFQTSCSPAVAPQFDRAVALLHSFEFGSSIKGFSDVLAVDSTCAMARWGISLALWSNPFAAGARSAALLQRAKQAAADANRLEARATEREREYIAAVHALYADYDRVDQRTRVVAYEHAMADLVAKQPADTEAKIFYALSLAASALPTDKTYANQLKAGAILEPLWAKQPNHPGLAHYIIHSYDYPALAARAKAAAERYASIAPSAAHALHMPSHTFTRVGMWEESIDANLRSIEVATRAGTVGESLHASDYLEYAYLQLGNDSAAKAVVGGLPALTARFDANAIGGAAPPSAAVFAIAAIPARYALERGDWAEAAALEPHPSAFPWAAAITHFARALGAARLGDTTRARASVDSLAVIRARLASMGEAYWAEQVAIQQIGADAWIDLAEHHDDRALTRMREAVTREDATDKSAVTPGPLAPARELLGDMLVQLGRPAEARAEYLATLAKEPNRRHSLRAVSGSSTSARR